MKICLSNKRWLGQDLTMDEALNRVLDSEDYEGGKLEQLEADVLRLRWVLSVILTPEQILMLIKCDGYPDAICVT